MTINDFKFTDENHFVAMEYYRLILNRTFMIVLTREKIIGIKVNGLVGVKTGNPTYDILHLHIDGDLQNPHAYINPKYIKRMSDIDLLSGDLTKVDRANFVINRSDVTAVEYDKSKKWGMGYYPHDGKVYVTQRDRSKREFIILGSQSGAAVRDRLKVIPNVD